MEKRYRKMSKKANEKISEIRDEQVALELPLPVARIRAVYNMTDYDKAKESLELTVKFLERLNPFAEASLKEGLEETLTVK